jgi:hypothetical protein
MIGGGGGLANGGNGGCIWQRAGSEALVMVVGEEVDHNP